MSEWVELLWAPLLAAGTLIAATAAAGHAVLRKRSAQGTIAWVGLIALVPLLGAFLYALFGINRIRRKASELRRSQEPYASPKTQNLATDLLGEHVCASQSLAQESWRGLSKVVARVTRQQLLTGNHIELLRDGDEAYPSMIEAIEQAETSITLSTYIFDNDEAGKRFIDALCAAHERGVAVHVLVDSIGAHYTLPTAVRALRRAGVYAETFMPILRPGKFTFLNLRTHRKILVIDGDVGFTGGINIRQKHVLKEDPSEPTHDTHFRIEGPLVYHLQRINIEDWSFTTGEELGGEAYFPPLRSRGEMIGRGIPDGPDEHFENLHWVLQGALTAARDRVVIITPYFLPEDTLLDMLQLTAMRGVRVDILLPQRSNLFYIDWASAPSWAPLLKHGCNIWLTPEPFDHSKLMVVDGEWSLLGSANWDPRSLRLNFEFNVEVYSEELAGDIMVLAREKLAHATQITLEDYEQRSLFVRLRDGIFRLGTPYL